MANLSKKAMHNIYDTLIQMSNDAYNVGIRHDDATLFSAQQNAKSEAYDTAAKLIAFACSIYNIPVDEKQSDMERDIEQQRREDCEADAELDFTELIYHEETHD